MRIMLMAPVWERVPPPAYGGTEAVVSLLADGLVDAGHDVVLYASGDSLTKAELRSMWPRPIRGCFEDRNYYQALEWVHAAFALSDAAEFDIVHNHCGDLALAFGRLIPTPMLTTFHNGPHVAWNVLVKHYPWYWNAISYAAARLYPGPGLIGVAHNSIDVSSFPFSAQKEDWLLWLSRISPEKGPVEAIEVARRLGRRLVMAGKVDQVDEEYYRAVVEPLIDGRHVVYAGEADARQKRDLYRRAACLLVPIKWEEPFGLVMAEAMACGTPVIAMNRGAAPEIVRHGVTGFIVNNAEEMADAVLRLAEIDPRMCRKHVAANFDIPHLVARYLGLYDQVLAREKARSLPTAVRPPQPGLATPSSRAA